MRKSILTIPEIGLIGVTRVALGAGLALLLADKLDRKERRAAGWALFLAGVATTVPLVLHVLSQKPAE
jgi:EamA domain-containing membrane protein RarD